MGTGRQGCRPSVAAATPGSGAGSPDTTRDGRRLPGPFRRSVTVSGLADVSQPRASRSIEVAEEPESRPKGRKQLARAAAERSLKDAALRLMRRDGLLAGLNLQEVADEASVNRGLIHRWFGSRRAFVRAVLRAHQERLEADVLASFDEPPASRTAWAVKQYAADPSFAHMVMLLAIDDDPELEPIPYLERRLELFRDEIARGRWAPDADPIALTVVWDVLLNGYFTMRTSLCRQLGLDEEELDRRYFAAVSALFASVLVEPGRPPAPGPSPPTPRSTRGASP